MTSFCHLEDDEETLDPKVSYSSVISVMMFLANCMRPDIAFSVNGKICLCTNLKIMEWGQACITLPPWDD